MLVVEVCCSHDFSPKDWETLSECFAVAFNQKKQPFELQNYYQSNFKGFSYHAVSRNQEGEIVAHSSIVPYRYNVNGEVITVGLSGGTFVMPAYRKEAFLFVDLIEELKAHCRLQGILITVGVPNKNSFSLTINLLGSKYLTDLHYYLFPVSLNKVFLTEKRNFVDNLSSVVARCWFGLVRICSFVFDVEEKPKPVRLQFDEEFKSVRFGPKYSQIKTGQVDGVYRMVCEEGKNTAYIFDFRRNGKRSVYALSVLMSHILKHENVDAILFIGILNFFQPLLAKVPRKFEPQRFPLTYDLLDESRKDLDEVLKNPDNWDFGLLNFDVR